MQRSGWKHRDILKFVATCWPSLFGCVPAREEGMRRTSDESHLLCCAREGAGDAGPKGGKSLKQCIQVDTFVGVRGPCHEVHRRGHPQLLEAFAEQLLRRSPCAAAALRDEHHPTNRPPRVQPTATPGGTKWQSSRPLSGSKFASCGAPCGSNCKEAQKIDRPATTTSTWTKSNTPGARRCRRNSPRSRCISTGSSPCCLCPI